MKWTTPSLRCPVAGGVARGPHTPRYALTSRSRSAPQGGVDVQGQQLTSLDELGVGEPVVGLGIQQIPARTEQAERLDDAGRLFVLGDEVGAAGDEARRVEGGDLDEVLVGQVVHPDLAGARIVADILQSDNA